MSRAKELSVMDLPKNTAVNFLSFMGMAVANGYSKDTLVKKYIAKKNNDDGEKPTEDEKKHRELMSKQRAELLSFVQYASVYSGIFEYACVAYEAYTYCPEMYGDMLSQFGKTMSNAEKTFNKKYRGTNKLLRAKKQITEVKRTVHRGNGVMEEVNYYQKPTVEDDNVGLLNYLLNNGLLEKLNNMDHDMYQETVCSFTVACMVIALMSNLDKIGTYIKAKVDESIFKTKVLKYMKKTYEWRYITWFIGEFEKGKDNEKLTEENDKAYAQHYYCKRMALDMPYDKDDELSRIAACDSVKERKSNKGILHSVVGLEKMHKKHVQLLKKCGIEIGTNYSQIEPTVFGDNNYEAEVVQMAKDLAAYDHFFWSRWVGELYTSRLEYSTQHQLETKKLKTITNENERCKKEISHKNTRIDKLDKELRESRKKYQQSEAECDKLRKRSVDNVEEMRRTMEKKVNAAEKNALVHKRNLDKAEEKNIRLEEEVAKLKEQLRDRQENYDILEEMIESYEAEYEQDEFDVDMNLDDLKGLVGDRRVWIVGGTETWRGHFASNFKNTVIRYVGNQDYSTLREDDIVVLNIVRMKHSTSIPLLNACRNVKCTRVMTNDTNVTKSLNRLYKELVAEQGNIRGNHYRS